jgi:poly(3-hydroxybutyrate) depolymerase
MVKTRRQTTESRRRIGILCLFAGALLLGARAARGAEVEKHTITFLGRTREYFLYVPPGISADHPAPLLMTLHGSGGKGSTFPEFWKDLADKEGIVVVGPNAIESARWDSRQDGPQFLHDVVEEVRAKYPIDGRRMYLFGHSAGAVFGLQMAALESEYFAAAVMSAGAIEPAYFKIFDYADRKIPMGIVIGTKDPLFPLSLVRPVAEALKSRGFPVAVNEIPGHDHNYRKRSQEINDWAWKFMSPVHLDQEPRYRDYGKP